ncbi:MAG: DNA repair protein RadA [bacterium]
MSFVCSDCQYESLKWSGKCPSCGEWGSLKEKEEVITKKTNRAKPAKMEYFNSSKKSHSKRMTTHISEFNRVLGGGLVQGQVVLLSGEPGIGKSTLILQLCVKLGKSVLYISGEESIGQLSNRLDRIKGSSKASGISVTEETDVDKVISAIEENSPKFIVVDSIQSLSTSDISGFSGSISQVRECGMRLTRVAKKNRIPMVIVGQVTKEGVVAGPKVIEHVVDTVLYFEGDEEGLYRVLRCMKNRFGPTDEVGLFEMTTNGLESIDDPTRLIESSNKTNSVGVSLSAVYKGSRVLIVEIQALTSPAAFGFPRRLPTGFAKSRLEMLCVVLTRRAGINLSGEDVFVNVMGGLNLKDPSIDLAVCKAIVSAKLDVSVDRSVYVGEVGLSGEVREVPFQNKIKSDVSRRKMVFVSSKKGSSSLSTILKA